MGSREGVDPPPPKQADKQHGSYVHIGDVLTDPIGANKKKVVLSGSFQGWQGKCSQSVMLTRSDWILKDRTGCIYVSGRLPSELSPTKAKGEHVSVHATIALHNGKPYLQAHDVRVLPPLPR